MQWDHLLHPFDVLHQSNQVVREDLVSGNRSYTTCIEGRGMDVTPLHQTELLAGQPAHLQRLKVECPAEGIEGPHDIRDGTISVVGSVWGFSALCLLKHTGIRLTHHLLAEVNTNQILLEDVVVEHVLCGLAQIENPLA